MPPARLRIDAWSGGPLGLSSAVGADAGGWALRSRLPSSPKFLLAEEKPDFADWRHPKVGWGLILADDDGVPEADRAAGADAPAPLQELLADRKGSPVLRYRADAVSPFGSLRRYFADGSHAVLNLAGTEFGLAPDRLPLYLLIYGGPEVVPWELQFALNPRFAVGRLDLEGPGLANYVAALRAGWAGFAAEPLSTVVWATDHGPDDITALMKSVVAGPVAAAYRADSDLAGSTVFLRAETDGATGATLLDALTERRPGMVVTTSHGAATPLDDLAAMALTIGSPVDDAFVPLDPSAFAGAGGWAPEGAIWYAHACCSAGTNAATVFSGLFDAGSEIAGMLATASGLGSRVSPLSRALLGHERPLRAFVGHVEPTFDWTLSEPSTGQALAGSIRAALYDNLFVKHPPPIGLALRDHYAAIGVLAAEQVALRKKFDMNQDVGDPLLSTQLAARDRMSLVILGDPTVTIGL